MSSEYGQQKFASVWDALADTPAEAENLRVRSQLMAAITKRINEFGWSQRVAATNLGVTQPRISDLYTGKIQKFSVDTLINMAGPVGIVVELSLSATETPCDNQDRELV